MPNQDKAIERLRQAVHDSQSIVRREENQTAEKLRQVVREAQPNDQHSSLQELLSSR